MVSSDKDFKPNIFQLFGFATVVIHEEFKDSEHPMDLLDSIEDRFDEMCEDEKMWQWTIYTYMYETKFESYKKCSDFVHYIQSTWILHAVVSTFVDSVFR